MRKMANTGLVNSMATGLKGKKNIKLPVLFFVLMSFVLNQDIIKAQSFVGADGLTFQQRKQRWLNSIPGNPASVTDPDKKREYLFGWLEKGTFDSAVENIIDNDFLQWEFTGSGGIHAQNGFAAGILIKYGSQYGNGILSASAEQLIKDKYEKDWIDNPSQ